MTRTKLIELLRSKGFTVNTRMKKHELEEMLNRHRLKTAMILSGISGVVVVFVAFGFWAYW